MPSHGTVSPICKWGSQELGIDSAEEFNAVVMQFGEAQPVLPYPEWASESVNRAVQHSSLYVNNELCK